MSENWIFSVLFFVLLFCESNSAQAWTRPPYSDPVVVKRADLIVIGHIKDGSITYLPHPIRDGAISWEHHAILVITEILKGACKERELPIIIHYGLDPIITTGQSFLDWHHFSEPGVQRFIRPGSHITIYDFGGKGGIISGDIREDQMWFLRVRADEYQGDDITDAMGIWDPEDIQPLNLKPYFQALLTDHPEEKIKNFVPGNSPLAVRSQIYLDHLKMEEILKEPNPARRADLLLPFFLFTDEQKDGPTQQEARFQLWNSCGEAGSARLIPVFKDPKYQAMQNDIMIVWSNEEYHDAVPVLIELLRKENNFWANQTPAERNLWVDMSANHEPTLAQILSKNRISMILMVFKQLADPRTKAILEETRTLWQTFYPHDPQDTFTDACNEDLLTIQNQGRLAPEKPSTSPAPNLSEPAQLFPDAPQSKPQ